MRHSGKKEQKRRNCSLRLLDILNVVINDVLYEIWMDLIIGPTIFQDFEKLQSGIFQNFTLKYNYPKELMSLKILMDLDKRSGCNVISQEISDYINKMNVTHNLTTQNIQDLNDLINRMVNTNPML